MYHLIENHIADWLPQISNAQVIQPYLDLQDAVNGVDVSQDMDFQRRFRHYYKLNQARLSPEFYQAFFGHLEHLKGEPLIPTAIEDVVAHLYATPTHGNGRQSIQFSFASKLLHTLYPNWPIYDGLVADFFSFPNPPARDFNNRVTDLMTSYGFLHAEYDRILTRGLLVNSIASFRAHFHLGPMYTDVKIIDTIIWRFSTWLRAGALRDGSVQFH